MDKDHLVKAKATHPGILIKDELDEYSDMDQKKLAEKLKVKPSYLNEVINGKRPVKADLAILLEKVLGISADYWMRFQSQYELDKARSKPKNIRKLKEVTSV